MTKNTGNSLLDRRALLNKSGKLLLGAGIAGAGIGQAIASAATSEEGVVPAKSAKTLPFEDPEWNRDLYARLQGDLDFGKQKAGWFSGTVSAVIKDKKVQPLFGFEGFSMTRLVDEGNGVYQKLLREVGFYTDLKTGDILEEWHNPFIDETVKVVPVANDPFNYKITAYRLAGPSYGGLNKQKAKKVPFYLPWKETGDGTIAMRTGIHLFYPNALDPKKWPRESAGKMNRVSEMFSYVINRDYITDPSKSSVTYSGAWSRITPWLPWMLMGQADGHIYYDCMMGGYNDLSIVSPKVLAYAEKNFPKYFEAPNKWTEPSFSSLENYARQQKPAPFKK